MKAAVCRAFGEPLSIEQVHLDPPAQGEIEVTIKACAICHSDIAFADGAWGGDLPMVLGHEAAGVVTGLGTGEKDFAIGDRVIVTLIRSCGHCHHCDAGRQIHCEKPPPHPGGGPIRANDGSVITQAMKTGAFAECVVVHASQAVRVPDDMAFPTASLLACGVITGFGAATRTAGIAPGQSAAVIGCGGVGLNAIQGAKFAGAHPLIAIDTQISKLDVARAFGATHAIAPSSADVAEEVIRLNSGRGVDHVLVTVGSTAVLNTAPRMLAAAGTLTAVGMPPVGALSTYEPVDLAALGQRIQGSAMGSARIRQDVPKLVELYQDGRLKLDELISNTYPLEAINEAIAEVKQGRVLRNVILFD